jgi:hypothetical protein
MPSQLLVGYTFSPDGLAINDFEAFGVGHTLNLNFGVQVAGGLSWGDSVVIERGSA